jgi:hypothetical protein
VLARTRAGHGVSAPARVAGSGQATARSSRARGRRRVRRKAEPVRRQLL